MFQKKPTAKEQLRASQRQVGNGVRDLEREGVALKREEAKLVKDIKAAAAKGNQPVARQLAKSLVRIRQQQAKLDASQAQLRGLRSNMTTAAATATVANSMGKAGQAMGAMSATMDPQKMQETMAAFARENQKLGMTEDMMGDAVDDMFEDDEEQSSEIMNQVLDEIGVELHSQLKAAPQHKAPVASAQAAPSKEDEELEAALAALRSS